MAIANMQEANSCQESHTVKDASSSQVNATREAYAELQLAYDYFNEHLFQGELPGAMITLQRHGRSMGFFDPDRFVSGAGQIGDEIALNPQLFATRPIEDTLSTLAHEMAHQWRYRNDLEPSRRCYHDKHWAEKMKAIGLYPSSTARPGGKEVGEKMSHYILPDGLFIRVCKAFLAKHKGIAWYDRFPMEGGKDYEYAANATVKVPGKEISTTQGDGRDSAGQLDQVEEPIFTPPPVESGLNVVSVEPRKAKAEQAPAQRKTDGSNRLKYSCPSCRVNVWGKPDLHVDCGSCKKTFIVV